MCIRDSYIASYNEPVRVEIKYFNNLQTEILNGEIRLKLMGNAFDKISVNPDQGLYRSADNEIVWNGITNEELKNIEAGGSGRVTFTITPRDLGTIMKPSINPYIKFNVLVKGNRITENDVPESISSSIDSQIRVASNISLGGKLLRFSGPFQNTGPIPPKAEQSTTYTVVWTIDNTSSSASDIVVRSSMPAYMKWTGKVEPAGEDISFNELDGQIIWNVGNIGTNTVGTNKRKEIAFQVMMNPGIDLVGTIPTILNSTSLVATDDFTGETLKSNLGVLSSVFSSDQGYKEGYEKVIR
jgi:hypothetical protein